MSNAENEPSDMDKLRMDIGEDGALRGLSAIERSQLELEVEALERGLTPKEILAERLHQTFRGEIKDE